MDDLVLFIDGQAYVFGYHYIPVYIFIAIFGACIGSFLNVVISRLPEQGAFLSDKRSHCPQCNQTIRWYDLFPVISWFILRGRCRDCKARISLRYLFVEITAALFAIVCLWRFGLNFQALIVFGVSMILLAVTLIDFDTSEIPDSLCIALIPFAVASIWLLPGITWLSHIIGIVTVALPMLLLSLFIAGAFGGGDIKLMAVCGLLLGWQLTLLAFFIALLLGGIAAIYLIASGRRERGQHMVFGPALCIGIVTALFYGSEIIGLYLGLFMF